MLQEFLTQFYEDAACVPKESLLPAEVEEARIIEEWLRSKRNTKVTLQVPRRGKKRELVEMATENAQDTLAALRQQWAADRSKHVTAITCLLYTSDAADERSSVDLGGRRIIKKKKHTIIRERQ